MRILLVCNDYPPGPHRGIGTFVQSIARGFSGRGHEVTVVNQGSVNEEHSDNGIQVVTFERNSRPYIGNLIARLRLRRWLSAFVKAHGIDIIELHDYLGLLPFGVDGCPVVVRLHMPATIFNAAAGVKVGRGIAFYERRTLLVNQNWIGVSNYMLNLTKSTFCLSPKRSAIIYNPVPPVASHLPEMTGLPANYIMYAGAVNRIKGAVVLAEAVRPLLAERSGLHLIYAGGIFKEGGRPISDFIRGLLGSTLAERVHFLGHLKREEVLPIMARASVFAFPSRLEAFGLVILEAMECGVPVVYTSLPPGPEVVEDGVTGLLADPNSPADFREKIARVLDDPLLARRLVGNARRILDERFSLRNCLDAKERFYEECLAQ